MSIFFLVAVCLATALAIRILQNRPRFVFGAIGSGSALLALILLTATDEPINLVGRNLTLDLAERVFLWPAILVTAGLALFGPLTYESAEETNESPVANSQSAFLFVSLAPLIISMALDSFPLASFFWSLSLIALILLAEPRREGRAGGAAYFLLLIILATSSLLIANRFLDLYSLSPENADLMRSATLFLVWGIGALLAVAPLHIWLGPFADEMPLLGIAFLVGVAQPVGLWFLFQLMSRLLWLTEKAPLLNVLVLGGLVTVPVGALLSLAERRQGRFIAFLSLISLGHALIGFGLGTRLGLAEAMLSMLNRAFGVVLLTGGLAFVRHHTERRWRNVGTVALLAGGLALAGVPPLLGVAARWGLYHELVTVHPEVVGLLIGSCATALLAVVRMATPLVCDSEGDPFEGEARIVPYFCTGVVAILIALLLVTGFFPQLVADPLLAAFGRADYLK